METDEASSKRQRRAHRKSRLGCLQCKKRKIKCDETRPSCLNCIRREIMCSPQSTPINGAGLVAQTSPSHLQKPYRRDIRFGPANVTSDCSIPCGNHGSSPGTAPSLSDQSSHQIQLLPQRMAIVESQLLAVISAPPSSHLPGLTYSDMELWHHYCMLTTTTLCSNNDKSSCHFWRVRLPELGFQHPHILHLVLGFAALHKSRFCAGRYAELRARAERHNMTGMRGATPVLGAIDAASYHAAYASAMLISLFYLALGPRPKDYIAFGDSQEGSLLVLLRGVRSIRELSTADVDVQIGQNGMNRGADVHRDQAVEPSAADGSTSYRAYLGYLRALAANSTDSDSAAIYLAALDSLEIFCAAASDNNDEDWKSKADSDPHSKTPFAWLYRLSDPFIDRLQRRTPLALAIFACWATVLGKLETGWVTEGWPEHIIFGIWSIMSGEHRLMIRWLMVQMGLREPALGDTPASSFPADRIC